MRTPRERNRHIPVSFFLQHFPITGLPVKPRRQSTPQGGNKMNKEKYSDPTAERAIANVDREIKKKHKKEILDKSREEGGENGKGIRKTILQQ